MPDPMMRNNRNYYQILHVQRDAPVAVIRSSYRTMMQQLKMHPDLGGDHDKAALVNQAYMILMNSKSRAEYDVSLDAEAEINSSGSQVKSKSSSSAETFYRKTDVTKYCSFCQTTHNLGKTIEPESICYECGSTLFPATKLVFEKDDQRVIKRIDKQWPVTFYTQWPDPISYLGQSQDVSLNGMQMLTTISLHEGQIIKMKSHMMDAVARVMNYREDYVEGVKLWRMGLEFITLRFYKTQGMFLKLDI